MTNPVSSHFQWMREAMSMAEEAFAVGEVPVGCVFVKDGEIIAKARNRTNELRNATRHAELEAIDEILSSNLFTPTVPKYPLSTTTLYVTVEPCMMCASALRQLGIKEVYFGCGNDRFGGCGSVLGVNETLDHPVHPPYRATGGLLREEAIMILRRFYITINTNGQSGPEDRGIFTWCMKPSQNPGRAIWWTVADGEATDWKNLVIPYLGHVPGNFPDLKVLWLTWTY